MGKLTVEDIFNLALKRGFLLRRCDKPNSLWRFTLEGHNEHGWIFRRIDGKKYRVMPF